MTTSKVVGSILLAGDQLLWVEKLTVCASAHLINDSGFEIDHHATRHVLASTCLREEGVESIIAATDCLVAGHLTIWLNAVLEAEKLPARIANLHAALAHVEAESFTHGCKDEEEGSGREGLGEVPKV